MLLTALMTLPTTKIKAANNILPLMSDGIKLIVGLGNPGQQYRFTRHNAGAMFLETLCDDFHGELRPESKFFGLADRISIAGHDVRLLFPTTFMNNSGQAVSAMARYYDIAPEDILVAYDELDLPVDTVRLKSGGGHGGHNGVRDIAKAWAVMNSSVCVSALADPQAKVLIMFWACRRNRMPMPCSIILMTPSEFCRYWWRATFRWPWVNCIPNQK